MHAIAGVKPEILGRSYYSVGNNLKETDEFGAETLYFSSAIQNSSTLLLCSQLPPKPPTPKQSIIGNVVNERTDPNSDLSHVINEYSMLMQKLEN